MSVIRLDAFNVRTLPPGEYHDDPASGVRGLVLRVSRRGARSFAIRYRHSRRYTLGRTPPLKLSEAREEGRRLLARVALGDDPAQARRAARAGELTVGDLADACLADLKLKPSTREEWERLAETELRPLYGKRAAVGLGRQEIQRDFKKLARRSDYTANRTFELLRRIFSWAVETDRIPGTPFVGIKKPGVELESDRVLSAEELLLLLRALDELPGQYAEATLALLLTGTREGMVVGSRRRELEALGTTEKRWIVPGERTKNGRPHVVPLSDQAEAVFLRRLKATSDYLFPPARVTRVQPEHMWWSSRFVARLCTVMEELLWCDRNNNGARLELAVGKKHPKSSIDNWTIHNLRAAIGTHMTEDLGVLEVVVSLILSHTPPGPRVSRLYNRAERLTERRAALVAWANWLDTLRTNAQRPAGALQVVK